jgi:hypothetical protein
MPITARRRPPVPLHVTERGLRDWAKFPDSYGNEVLVRDSSGQTPTQKGRAVWVLCRRNPEHVGEFASPHLTVPQAKKLIRGLEKFIASQK